MADRIFEINGKQLKLQRERFDSSAEVKSLTESLIKERIAAEGEVGSEDKASILSDDYIVNTLEDMFSAGYETTSTTLRWAIAFLIHNPEFQNEIQDKLDEVVGRDRMPTLDDRPKLPLVQATIMEALRLGNVAETAIPHYTLKDTTLGDYRVPKDTVVMVNLQYVHLDPKCWENPISFNPHRHTRAIYTRKNKTRLKHYLDLRRFAAKIFVVSTTIGWEFTLTICTMNWGVGLKIGLRSSRPKF